jgi:hypothetical protein
LLSDGLLLSADSLIAFEVGEFASDCVDKLGFGFWAEGKLFLEIFQNAFVDVLYNISHLDIKKIRKKRIRRGYFQSGQIALSYANKNRLNTSILINLTKKKALKAQP